MPAAFQVPLENTVYFSFAGGNEHQIMGLAVTIQIPDVILKGNCSVPKIAFQIPCSARRIAPARSPMMTHGAMVLPVVTLGMIDPSAIRSLSMP